MLRQEHTVRVVCPTRTSLPNIIGAESFRKVPTVYCSTNVCEEPAHEPSVASAPPVGHSKTQSIGQRHERAFPCTPQCTGMRAGWPATVAAGTCPTAAGEAKTSPGRAGRAAGVAAQTGDDPDRHRTEHPLHAGPRMVNADRLDPVIPQEPRHGVPDCMSARLAPNAPLLALLAEWVARQRMESAPEKSRRQAAAFLPQAGNTQEATEPYTDWTPALRRLADFLREAGIKVSARADRRLYLGDIAAGKLPLLEQSASLASPGWRTAVDELVWVHARETLGNALRRHGRFGDGIATRPELGRNGFALFAADKEIGIIHATHAFVRGRDLITGNFLIAGDHWDQVERAVRSAGDSMRTWPAATSPDTAAAPSASPDTAAAPSARRFSVLPQTLAPELRDACMEASRRIRLERRTAFERRVVLECSLGELAIEPIKTKGNNLHVPFLFRWAKGGHHVQVHGQLALTRIDPLPLLVTGGADEVGAHIAWVHMLLGFAELTCNGPEPTGPRRLAGHPPTGHRDSTQNRHPGTREGYARIRRPWSDSLEPAGRWYAAGGTYVAAHISRLPFEREHSEEAAHLALQVGIRLKQHETWVRDHVRGVPKDAEIRFRWRTPPALSARQTNW